MRNTDASLHDSSIDAALATKPGNSNGPDRPKVRPGLRGFTPDSESSDDDRSIDAALATKPENLDAEADRPNVRDYFSESEHSETENDDDDEEDEEDEDESEPGEELDSEDDDGY